MCHRQQLDATRTGNDVHRRIAPGQYDVKKRPSIVQRYVTVGTLAVLSSATFWCSYQDRSKQGQGGSGKEAMPPQT